VHLELRDYFGTLLSGLLSGSNLLASVLNAEGRFKSGLGLGFASLAFRGVSEIDVRWVAALAF